MKITERQAQHLAIKYASAEGWIGSCWCGWRTARKTRELRDRDVDAHECQPTERVVAPTTTGGAG